MMKTAQATENAPATRARVVGRLGGASRLKPKKITKSHKISAINNGFETDETAWDLGVPTMRYSGRGRPCPLSHAAIMSPL